MGRPRRGRRFFLFDHPFSVEFYGLIPQLIFSHRFIFIIYIGQVYFFGLGLYIQRLDQIIVWSFSWLFITLSLLDAVVNHPYQYLLSYFDTFSLGGLRYFDYFVLVNWHHLLLCKQDKQHTVTLACSMVIIHVPFLCQIFHISARRSLLLLSASLGWGRAPTCLEFPRRYSLSRCRAGE